MKTSLCDHRDADMSLLCDPKKMDLTAFLSRRGEIISHDISDMGTLIYCDVIMH